MECHAVQEALVQGRGRGILEPALQEHVQSCAACQREWVLEQSLSRSLAELPFQECDLVPELQMILEPRTGLWPLLLQGAVLTALLALALEVVPEAVQGLSLEGWKLPEAPDLGQMTSHAWGWLNSWSILGSPEQISSISLGLLLALVALVNSLGLLQPLESGASR